MSPSATNRAISRSSPMPDLSPTRLHLEVGLRENRWAGYSLAGYSSGHFFSLHGGSVSAPSQSVPWYSAGKPITAIGVLQILSRNPSLTPLPMEKTFPELKQTYVGSLSLEAILTHRTGLRFPNLPLHSSEKEIFAILASSQPQDFSLRPGQAAYDPRGGWWLLGQWLSRHTGQPWADFLREHVLQHAGASNMFFANANQHSDVPMAEKRGDKWVPVPPSYGSGGGLCGSAADLALLYQTLLCAGTSPSSGKTLLNSSSLEKLTRRWREGEVDMTFGHVVDFGLGVILDSNRYGSTTVPYGFGATSSEKSYGHGGARSSIAFADPENHLALAVCLVGLVPENIHQPRMRGLLDQLRSDLA